MALGSEAIVARFCSPEFITKCIRLLFADASSVRNAACWLIGNCAGTAEQFHSAFLGRGVFDQLLLVATNDNSNGVAVEALRAISVLMSHASLEDLRDMIDEHRAVDVFLTCLDRPVETVIVTVLECLEALLSTYAKCEETGDSEAVARVIMESSLFPRFEKLRSSRNNKLCTMAEYMWVEYFADLRLDD